MKTARYSLSIIALVACSAAEPELAQHSVPEITGVFPRVVLPGSRLVVEGHGFAGDGLGLNRLALHTVDEAGGVMEMWLPVAIATEDRLVVELDRELWSQLPAGLLNIEVAAVVEIGGSDSVGAIFSSRMEVREHLEPASAALSPPEFVYVNDELLVTGGAMLLGGAEGYSQVRLNGCVERNDVCEPLADTTAQLQPAGEFDRSAAFFAWLPGLSGVRAGHFRGSLSVENHHADELVSSSASVDLELEIEEVVLFGPASVSASLGQYVDIDGAGFVQMDEHGATLLHFSGALEADGTEPRPVDVILVPAVSNGRQLRYVVAEEDALGQLLDLRAGAATFAGQLTPIVSYRDEELEGAPVPARLQIEAVKQVIYLDFTPSYKKSLGLFGLAAADSKVRERAKAVIERDYEGINVDVRLEPPGDFALYSVVSIGGVDPNGLGLIGNDNTPGKDIGNERLHDRLGGVNAVTQFDGYPGYGGVFIESLFVYSKHPIGDMRGFNTQSTADPRFDEVFDAVRADRGGEPAAGADLQGAALPTSAAVCDGEGRDDRVSCAVWVLGSLIGTTLSHEIGHSIGLADPWGEAFHNFGDGQDRIMDRGSNRPFGERAELDGEGPGMFCLANYEYLREIMPAPGSPGTDFARPSCD